MTFPPEFIFVFILYFIGTILSKKSCQKQGVRKDCKKGGWPYRGTLSIEGCFKPFTNWYWETEKGDLESLNYWGGPQTPLHTMVLYGKMSPYTPHRTLCGEMSPHSPMVFYVKVTSLISKNFCGQRAWCCKPTVSEVFSIGHYPLVFFITNLKLELQYPKRMIHVN